MSNKSRKQKKKEKEAQRKTKPAPVRPKLSFQDMLRIFPGLMLRAFVVVTPLTLIMTWLGGSGYTLFNNFWLQMGTYAAAYVVFNNFIFGPIRNYRPGAQATEKSSSKSKA